MLGKQMVERLLRDGDFPHRGLRLRRRYLHPAALDAADHRDDLPVDECAVKQNEEFLAWGERARAKKRECDEGTISVDEFREWLENS